jgi:putative SOS response-associated peptidase YedK
MCGRYAIFGPISRNNRDVIQFLDRELEFDPAYNAAPTQQLPVFRVTARGRELALLRWGLVPYWAKNAAIGAKMINARADTLAGKPAFQSAFSRRRCLVPMSGFYEWKKGGRSNIPHYIHLLNAELFAAAGLYEFWPGKDGAAPIESFTIVTTEANEVVRNLHDRMPVIVHEADYEAWLDPKNADTAALEGLLAPYPAEEMRAYPVGLRVNSANNNDAELIAPAQGLETRDLGLETRD